MLVFQKLSISNLNIKTLHDRLTVSEVVCVCVCLSVCACIYIGIRLYFEAI